MQSNTSYKTLSHSVTRHHGPWHPSFCTKTYLFESRGFLKVLLFCTVFPESASPGLAAPRLLPPRFPIIRPPPFLLRVLLPRFRPRDRFCLSRDRERDRPSESPLPLPPYSVLHSELEKLHSESISLDSSGGSLIVNGNKAGGTPEDVGPGSEC